MSRKFMYFLHLNYKHWTFVGEESLPELLVEDFDTSDPVLFLPSCIKFQCFEGEIVLKASLLGIPKFSRYFIILSEFIPIAFPSARLMWTFASRSNGMGGELRVFSSTWCRTICWTKQYFQNVVGCPLLPEGHNEQWMGTFVQGALVRKAAAFKYCIPLNWNGQVEVVVSLRILCMAFSGMTRGDLKNVSALIMIKLRSIFQWQ